MDAYPASPSTGITAGSRRATSGPSSTTTSPPDTAQRPKSKHPHHGHHQSTKPRTPPPPPPPSPPSWLSKTTRKLSKLTAWLSTSEPSAAALRQHRKHHKHAFQRAGLSRDEAEPHAKLHAPVGQIPREAIRPGGRGLSPEEVLVRERRERRERKGRRKEETGRGQNGFGFGGRWESGKVGEGGEEVEGGRGGEREPDWSSLGSFSVYSGQESMKGSLGGLPYAGSSDKSG